MTRALISLLSFVREGTPHLAIEYELLLPPPTRGL